MPDTTRWKTWTDPVDVVARALDDVATAAAANAGAPSAAALRTIAGEVLDELLAEPVEPPPVVERDADAVRLVDELLVELMADKTLDMSSRTLAERIVDTLLGVPAVTMHYDDGGRIEVDWQDTPTHRPRACIVARDLLDDIVERLQPRPAEAGQPCPTCGTACTGDAWSDRLDAHTDCEHPCHMPELNQGNRPSAHEMPSDVTPATHPEGGLVPLGESGVSKSPDGTR